MDFYGSEHSQAVSLLLRVIMLHFNCHSWSYIPGDGDDEREGRSYRIAVGYGYTIELQHFRPTLISSCRREQCFLVIYKEGEQVYKGYSDGSWQALELLERARSQNAVANELHGFLSSIP